MSTGIPRPRTASFSLHISTTGSTSVHTASPSTNSPSNLGRVPLDARVVLSKRRSGYVRFIGKLKNEAGEWYGVALDEAKGDNDGRWLGEQLFQCAPNHGVFVRRKEIFYIKEQPSYVKGPPSPVMNDTSDDGNATGCSSNASSDSSVVSHDSLEPSAGASPPAPTSTFSPLQRTFKSFHRALQAPARIGHTLLSGATTTSPLKPAPITRKASTRASLIPPPAIASSSRHQSRPSMAIHQHATATPAAMSPEKEKKEAETSSTSIFEEDQDFAAMTRALAEQNNATNAAPLVSSPEPVLPLPPQIDSESNSSHEASPTTTPQRRPTAERRHSTFALGTPSAAATAAANAVRVVELEKEIVSMRTNHENVVAVLRATNKQHAANVLELRAQVSALADGNGYLQRQLSLKSTQLQELRQAERTVDQERSGMQAELKARDLKIRELEEEIERLKAQMKSIAIEKESVLLQMRREFEAKQRRDRDQIKRLREDVVTLCNDRNAIQSELQDAREMSFFL